MIHTPHSNAANPKSFWIELWLYLIAIMIAAMVIVGGATRLTDSGLSITEWQPIMGAIPPLGHEDWQNSFEKYRQIPEYQLVNKGMSLEEFKFIFWWEWGHRFLGRIIGLVFFIPAAIFWISGVLPSSLKPKIVGLFILGGLQGVVGWWMVASGLVDRVDVSQYRLAIHLTLACFLFAATLWVALGLRDFKTQKTTPFMMNAGLILLTLTFIQIFAGGLVAGMDAGLAYNTWPLMDGAFIPSGLWPQAPFWLNMFENPKTVQFDHRMLAYVLWGLALLHALWVSFKPVTLKLKALAWLVFVVLSVQAKLGIMTLLLAIPLDLALYHQFGALIVLAVIVLYLRQLKGGAGFMQG